MLLNHYLFLNRSISEKENSNKRKKAACHCMPSAHDLSPAVKISENVYNYENKTGRGD